MGGTGSPRRKFLRITLIVFGVAVVSAVVLFGVVWALTPIPDSTQPKATAQGSVIYYRDGRSVLARQGVNRKSVTLDKVPESLENAVIAAENRSFYEDRGVSLRGTFRAMWSTLTGNQVQGGSTITQQLVRNYYSGLSQERSIVRKLKEVMISLKVDQSQSKDWVLERYLNTIYFGRGANGVQAAAEAYFRKDVDRLTLAESAYLAAVIQQPSRFADPRGADLDAARARWRSVVDGMVETGAITPEEAAQVTFPTLRKPKAIFTPRGQEGYMLDQVTTELKRRGYTDEIINQGGLKIVSTFDENLMAAAERAVTSTLPEGTPKQVRTGLAAVDPATGEVLAFYGGRSYAANKFDNSFSAKVQAGSTFKAYALAAALESGLGLDTRVDGNSPLHIASADIPNSGGQSYGQIDLVKATQSSVNTAFVDLGQRVGLDRVVEVAEDSGIPAEQLAPHRGAATLPLGVASVSAVQNASGFATFAAEGVHREAHVIRSITDAEGRTTRSSTRGERAFSEQTAVDATYALTQVVQAGTGSAARLYDRPVAGKTGTTDESAAVWFAGFTPQLSVAVNMFRDDNKPVTVNGSALYGGTYPAQIWRAFMTEAMDGKPVKEFGEPSSYGYRDYGYPGDDLGHPGDEDGDQDTGTQPPIPAGTGAPDPGTSTGPDGRTPGPDPTAAPDDGDGAGTEGGGGEGDGGDGPPDDPGDDTGPGRRLGGPGLLSPNG
ncbi:membrane peptidoglycan carboxypeptidase [Streptosporangium becharense]|uniref:Membrane peptidoglycan carboxypeptidase n=1 Tax=Streptosporangium becharense TaxID=1816182 RepID=A0A7W9IJB7_9ACTN|nr:transglycosylase domain-containing protein [Streptosporangium becharense]MBB2913404.1 membrane peptidoglycan carboxypeptidase [Streptosporangium becharense]MBB5821094.1 membrane peptidoglycan carboxypeptidase [Streptosporangium becharense]